MDDDAVEEALRQVREGSSDAYEVVVRAYQGRLRAMLAGFCPPGVDPDELAHLAFVEAFKKIDQYAPHTRFFAWLSTIARILLLVELRRSRREARGREGYLEQAVTRTVEEELQAEGSLDDARVVALRDCMTRLPEALRSMLSLRYSKDASIGTISQHTGKSASAVKFQLFAIRRKLRECVNRKIAMGQG